MLIPKIHFDLDTNVGISKYLSNSVYITQDTVCLDDKSLNSSETTGM